MIYHPKSKQIIGVDISSSSQHDIKLARKTVKKFKHCEYVMTDLGYYGLEQDGFKLLMPIKEKKNFPLFKVEKKYNKMIGKIRVVIALIVNWKDLEYSVNAIEIDGKDSVCALT